MADPKKDELKNDAKAPKDELAAAKAELAELNTKKELELLKAEIAVAKASLKQQAGRDRAARVALEKRERTAKEGDLALYVVNDRSYKPLAPGMPAGLIEKGTVIRVKADTIPGPSMLAVEPAAAVKSDKFRALSV
jgi:multidrug efflux pump subunit AcrA (membrane-fusion protein)